MKNDHTTTEQQLSIEFFKEQGRIGGLKGGALAWKDLTGEQRSERARDAVMARWKRAKQKKKAKAATATAEAEKDNEEFLFTNECEGALL